MAIPRRWTGSLSSLLDVLSPILQIVDSREVSALGALGNSRQIDMVLSDIVMPGNVSGFQLDREIRRRHPTLPIVPRPGTSRRLPA